MNIILGISNISFRNKLQDCIKKQLQGNAFQCVILSDDNINTLQGDYLFFDADASLSVIEEVSWEAKKRGLKIAFFTSDTTVQHHNKLLALGPAGVFQYCVSDKVLTIGIKKLFHDSHAFEVFETAIINLPASIRLRTKLSFREQQIMELLLMGRATGEIALILKRENNTIATIKSRLFKKWGVNNLMELYKVYSYYRLLD